MTDAALRKVTLRLVPFLCLLYIFNLLDRANVGFARLQMIKDLPIEKWQIDLGYGLFYVGYLLFEVPSNLLLRRVGARHWIARIMMTWGLVGCLTLAVTGPWSFYLVRILLGVAEAGFFPGIVLYLTYWFPARDRARVMALFMSGNAIAGIVGNPLNGAIMEHLNGAAGLAGWQWLFLIEGIPSVLLGFAVLLYLTDRPEQARWLTTEERAWLVERMTREEQHRQRRHGGNLTAALTDGRVWLLICLYFTVAVGANASAAYLPSLIKDRFMGWRPSQIGLLAALPHVSRDGEHDHSGDALRPNGRAAQAPGVRGLPGGGGLDDHRLQRLCRDDGRRWLADQQPGRVAVDRPGRVLPGPGGDDGDAADLLGAAHLVPQRGRRGRGDRPDQFDGQPGWVDRPHHSGTVRARIDGPDAVRRRNAGPGRPARCDAGQEVVGERASHARTEGRAGRVSNPIRSSLCTSTHGIARTCAGCHNERAWFSPS